MADLPPGALAERLAGLIERGGPLPVWRWMELANARYYASRDPLGAAGDFTTAPEVSQMFGELVGLWAADLTLRAGAADAAWVELGPGRGTLSRDALGAMASAGLTPEAHLVETSPTLRRSQARLVPTATWHDEVDTLPADRPLVAVANEFFDALPVQQLVREATGWRERVVEHSARDGFRPVPGPAVADALVPDAVRRAPVDAVWEHGAAGLAIARRLGERIGAQGGALLAIDYGYEGPAWGDTLQAVRAHEPASPWGEPGERDLTAHVDFGALGAALSGAGLRVQGPVGQGEWLERLGLGPRAHALARAHPERTDEIAGQRERLAGEGEMGALFRVLAARAPGWPEGEGFWIVPDLAPFPTPVIPAQAGIHADGRSGEVRWRDGSSALAQLTRVDPRLRGDDGEATAARDPTAPYLRSGSPTDAPALAALARDSFAETFGHLYSPENLAAFLAGHTADGWAAILASPDDAVRVVEADGRFVGYARIGQPKLPFESEPGALELRQFYLLRPAHGTGLADELMTWILDEAIRRGAPAIYLSVFKDNARAIRFYARHGFQFVTTHAFLVGEHRDTDHILRRDL